MSNGNNNLDILIPFCPVSELNILKKENERLSSKISELLKDKELLTKDKELLHNIILNRDKTIVELKEENEKLNNRVNELENAMILLKEENKKLNCDICLLKEKNIKFDALVKLNECNAIVNKNFKKEYRKWFSIKRTEYVPNINDIIDDPPNENDDKDLYDFWSNFLLKYPRSNDLTFRTIYYSISSDRANIAHINVNKLTMDEFDELIKIAYPTEYTNNKKLYDDYRDWLFLFPLC